MFLKIIFIKSMLIELILVKPITRNIEKCCFVFLNTFFKVFYLIYYSNLLNSVV